MNVERSDGRRTSALELVLAPSADDDGRIMRESRSGASLRYDAGCLLCADRRILGHELIHN